MAARYGSIAVSEAAGRNKLSWYRGHYRWIVHAALLNVCLQCIMGANRIGFARALGAADEHIGYLQWFARFVLLGQIFTPLIAERLRQRKLFCLLMDALGRGVWLIIAIVPLLISPRLGIWAAIALIGLATFFIEGATPAKQSWQADLVPHEVRGRFFGMNNLLVHFTTIATLSASGVFIVYWNQRIGRWSYSLLIAFGIALAFAALYVLARVPEPPKAPTTLEQPRQFLLSPLRHPGMRMLILFFGLRLAVINLGADFFQQFLFKELSLQQNTVNFIQALDPLCQMLSNPFWGPLVDRYGAKRMIWFGAIAQIFIPLLWLLATTDNWKVVMVGSRVWGGIMLPPVQLGLMKIVFQTAPRENRSMHLGGYNALVNQIGSLGPLATTQLLPLFRRAPLVLWGTELTPIRGLFFVSMIGRALILLVLWKCVHEPRSVPKSSS